MQIIQRLYKCFVDLLQHGLGLGSDSLHDHDVENVNIIGVSSKHHAHFNNINRNSTNQIDNTNTNNLNNTVQKNNSNNIKHKLLRAHEHN